MRLSFHHRGPLGWGTAALWSLLGCAAPVPPGSGPSTEGGPGALAGQPDTIRVLAYNIHHAEGVDGRLDLSRIARLIREVAPDLVALQEVDRRARRTAGVDQASVLAEWTGLEPVFGPFMPYQGGEYGMAVLSRWPVVSSVNHPLPDGPEPRTSVAVRVRSPETGREIVFAGIHFYRTEQERMAQAQALMDALTDESVPTLLAGDFNSTPGSAVLEELSRSWTVLTKGVDRLTFPSYGAEREIDFVMVRPGDRFEVVRHDVLDEPVASDHRPIFVELIVR